jgi:hypothetical protein
MDYPQVEVTSFQPDYCVQQTEPVPAPPTDCYSCHVVDSCKQSISNQEQITVASQTFLETQTEVQNSIDNETGCMLGQHFSLSVVVVATPSVRDDQSMDLNCVVNFHPLQKVLQPTKDHKRVYCPCVKKYLTKLAKFNDVDVQNADCQWGRDNNNQNNQGQQGQKRGLSQASAGSSNWNSDIMTLNFPAAAVKRVFAGASNSNSTTPSTTPPLSPTEPAPTTGSQQTSTPPPSMPVSQSGANSNLAPILMTFILVLGTVFFF